MIRNMMFGFLLTAAALCLSRAWAGQVTVLWNPVTTAEDGAPLLDLAGYRLFYSTKSFASGGGYITTAEAAADASIITVDVSSSTTSRALTLTDGYTYYFRVAAYDSAGRLSVFNINTGGYDVEISTALPVNGGGSGEHNGGTSPSGLFLAETASFPNPAVGKDPTIRCFVGEADTLEVTIFDASGAVVHAERLNAAPTGTINGRPYHDYVWKGSKSSGVYFAVIHGKKDGDVIRGRVKFAVVR